MLGTCTEISVSSGKNPDLFERGDEGETKKRCVIAEIELGALITSHHNEFRAGTERRSDYPISSSSSVQVMDRSISTEPPRNHLEEDQ